MKKVKRDLDAVARFNRISTPTNTIFSIMFIVLALVCVVPVVFVAIISLSSNASIQRMGYSFIPDEWSVEAYRYLWRERATIGQAFTVSIGVTVVGTVLGLFLTSTMGYVISRPTFLLKRFFTTLIFIPMLFSGGLVASFLINTRMLGLQNSYLALILPIAVSSFNCIIMRTYFQTTVPDSIVESAKIDGARQLLIFFRIILPISLPAMATIGLLLSIGYWNDWFSALLYIQPDRTYMYPLQYVLINIERNMEFLTRSSQFMTPDAAASRIPAESTRMAIVMVVVLPIACSYPFFQKYFISGLTIGSVKG